MTLVGALVWDVKNAEWLLVVLVQQAVTTPLFPGSVAMEDEEWE